MVTSITKGGTQKLPPKLKIVVTYRYDHSLKNSFSKKLSRFLKELMKATYALQISMKN
jgi:serine acetyltransferase